MAQTDYRLTIDRVRGELKRTQQNEGLEILSFQFSTDAPHDAATGQATGRRRYSDVTFTKLLDKSSPVLQLMLAQHSKIRKATLTCYKAGDHGEMLKYYEVAWSDAFISSYRVRGADMKDEYGALPREEFTLNFRKIEVNYSLQASLGGSLGSTSFSDELNSNDAAAQTSSIR
jgi:type VI secretion system secreted protein Hcp